MLGSIWKKAVWMALRTIEMIIPSLIKYKSECESEITDKHYECSD